MNSRSIKPEFRTVWTNEVSEIAHKCAPAEIFNMIQELESTSDHSRKEELTQKLQESSFHDLTGLFYIGHMISDVNRALLRDMLDLNTINSTAQIQGTLNSESYWANVWHNDQSTEEAQNLKKLGEVMGNLIRVM